MSIADIIRALLGFSGKKTNELAEELGISPQALNNKMNRESFSVEDLMIIAKLTDTSLVFEKKDNSKVYLYKREEFDAYSLSDSIQAAKLMSMALQNQKGLLADFMWFVNSAKNAVTKKAEMELTQYPNGTTDIKWYNGKIEQMTIFFNSEHPDQSTIIFVMAVERENGDAKKIESSKFSYNFDATKVEENRNSNSLFQKYYINENDGDKYTIIFKE